MTRNAGLLVVMMAHMTVFTVSASSNERAPQISMANFRSEQAYKQGEDVTINCQADGVPTPTYKWKWNGKELNFSRDDLDLQPGTGNLIIKRPTSAIDGDYNCLASNKLGTAVGLPVKLKMAEIATFPTLNNPTVMTPTVGESMIIPCTPPESYPKGSSYFGFNRPGSSKLENIENNNRVMLDYEGNLYFANVVMNDSLNQFGENVNYLCVSNNVLLGAYVQGNDHKVIPRLVQGSPTHRTPHLLYPKYSNTVAIKGQTKFLKCIFGGLPTPKVTWYGDVNERFVIVPDGGGTEIRFDNVNLDDEGHYVCSASNSDTDRPVSHRIKLTVESPPIWHRTPVDQHVDEESDVEIDCSVIGTPAPNISWSINGVHVDNVEHNNRRTIEGFRLSYKNVNINDSQVIQCMSSNKHGTILANIILKVNAEPPSFLETPGDKKVVEGSNVVFKCNTRGAPKPAIKWTRGKPSRQVSGKRFSVNPHTGALEVKDAQLLDTDIYQCEASNKHGVNTASAELTVRSPTLIRTNPRNQIVNASTEVIIPCEVTTDPEEAANLLVEWRRSGERIDFQKEKHMYVDKMDYSLRIQSSKVEDTGDYKCNATNGLDSAESSVSHVTVRDRPDPPYNVEIITCNASNIEISWIVGNDNNDQITEFIVHYNSSHSSHNTTLGSHDEANFSPGSRNQLNIPAKPFVHYTFYVSATNGMGRSLLSRSDGASCTTPSRPPWRNPGNVCGKLKGPRQLVITWDPMPEDEFNGEEFHYVVGYKQHGSRERIKEETVDNPKLGSLTIYEQPTFTAFEVYVRANNKKGPAPFNYDEKRLTYSGEGKPLNVPTNFRLVEDSLNGSYAEFSWEPVDTSPEKVRGFFRGYEVVFWKSAHPEMTRSEEIFIDKPFKLCDVLPPPDVEPEGRRRRHSHHHLSRHVRSAGQVRGSTNKLWPLSKISATVRVLNQGQYGDNSNIIEFETPEGVPGRVSNLKIIERGTSHLVVEWQLPKEHTGDILRFVLDYSVAKPAGGRTRSKTIYNPNQRTYKIRELDYSTKYRIFVAGITAAGVGEAEDIIGETLPLSDPDAPKIGRIDPGESWANVSWHHSDKQHPENPGSSFYVEYKGPDNDTRWRRVEPDPESNENWVNITDLEKGRYEIRVVATSLIDETVRETKSQTWIVYIGEDTGVVEPEPDKEALIYQHASAGWFIILMCIIALLLLILLVVCILRRARGDMYPVYEKEKMWRHHPLSPDETPFGEYTPSSDNPNLSKSQGSLDSDEKPMDSDSDSLGEYEDQDASKFNEDGSFIGQYTGKRKGDTSRPSAVNTSV